MRDAFKDPWFRCAFLVLSLASCVPIWAARDLPLLDLPNHLASISIWHYYDDPSWDFQRFYELNLVPLPYWIHYLTVHLLTYLTGNVITANKLFLTAYVIGLPLAALVFAHRFRRSYWLSLFI